MHLYDDDIIMSYWVRSIELRYLEFHARTLCFCETQDISNICLYNVLDPIDFHSMDKNSWNILHILLLCSTEARNSYSFKMTSEFYFWLIYPFKLHIGIIFH